MEMRMLLSDWVASELHIGNWHPPFFFTLSIFGIYVSARVLVNCPLSREQISLYTASV